MKNLIQEVLEIDSQANSVIEQAQSESKTISESVKTKLSRRREELEQSLSQQIAAHRIAAEARYAELFATEKAAHASLLAAIGRIGGDVVHLQAEIITRGYREL
jgi:hypothetical protein